MQMVRPFKAAAGAAAAPEKPLNITPTRVYIIHTHTHHYV